MATVDDAYTLVTDRQFAALGHTTADQVPMRVGDIVRALIELGAEDELSARLLIVEASDRAGGTTAIEHYRGRIRGGGPELRPKLELWMPAGSLTDNGD